MIFTRILSVTFCLGLVAVMAMPQSALAQDTPPAASVEDDSSPQRDALNTRVRDVFKTLQQDEMNHFSVMYTNYTIYSMVKAVREDVQNAVNACVENNSRMEEDINKRFNVWDKNVSAVMNESLANINNMKKAQSYIPAARVDSLFSLVDDVRGENSSRFETTPVTTPEACEFMLTKMDETEQDMTRMLQATLISYPNLLRKTQQ